jgi:four helix bundle protein
MLAARPAAAALAVVAHRHARGPDTTADLDDGPGVGGALSRPARRARTGTCRRRGHDRSTFGAGMFRARWAGVGEREHTANTLSHHEVLMSFQVHDVAVQMNAAVAHVYAKVRAADAGLADQLKRAAQSVPLNIDEGNRRAGRDRLQLWRIAAGSAAEVRSALEVAAAWGYIDAAAAKAADELADRVNAMLFRLGAGWR